MAIPEYILGLAEFGHGDFGDAQLTDKCAYIRAIREDQPAVDQPRISVVVPAHNESRYILGTLLGLAMQTHQQCETIIVCNGEPYGAATQTICEAAGFPVIHEPKKGIGLARNIGLREAKGTIVATTDADTVMTPDWLTAASSYFEASDCKAARGDMKFLGLGVSQRVYATLARFVRIHLRDRDNQNVPILPGFNAFFDRKLALEKGGYRTDLSCREDEELGSRILPNGGIHFMRSGDATVFSSARRLNGSLVKYVYQQVRNHLFTTPLGLNGRGYVDFR